jgi:hypothetical protein
MGTPDGFPAIRSNRSEEDELVVGRVTTAW